MRKLLSQRQQILVRNFKRPGFEIDIISRDLDGEIVATEVKYRKFAVGCCQQVFHRLYPQAKVERLSYGLEIFLREKNLKAQKRRLDGYFVTDDRHGNYVVLKYFRDLRPL